jgi:hypothetical protein
VVVAGSARDSLSPSRGRPIIPLAGIVEAIAGALNLDAPAVDIFVT